MQIAVRPFLTAGVAIVGAGLAIAAPIAMGSSQAASPRTSTAEPVVVPQGIQLTDFTTPSIGGGDSVNGGAGGDVSTPIGSVGVGGGTDASVGAGLPGSPSGPGLGGSFGDGAGGGISTPIGSVGVGGGTDAGVGAGLPGSPSGPALGGGGSFGDGAGGHVTTPFGGGGLNGNAGGGVGTSAGAR
jgi:hypothetical protein